MSERNLILRALSALILIPLFAVVFWSEVRGIAVVAAIAGAIALNEFARLGLASEPPRARAVLVVLGTAFVIAVYLRPDRALLFALLALVLLALDTLATATDLGAGARRLAFSVFGVIYVGGFIVCLPLIRLVPDGAWWLTSVFVVTFANDTGAYFAGRALGRHKLAPSISPGKTVEGAIGGLCAGVLILIAMRALLFSGMRLGDAIAIGVAAGILGPTGDLMESMLKRAAGAKDSGNLLPGHGGMLDRIDALLFVGAYVLVHVHYLR